MGGVGDFIENGGKTGRCSRMWAGNLGWAYYYGGFQFGVLIICISRIIASNRITLTPKSDGMGIPLPSD
jgi:hypothetical protein